MEELSVSQKLVMVQIYQGKNFQKDMYRVTFCLTEVSHGTKNRLKIIMFALHYDIQSSVYKLGVTNGARSLC